MPDSVVARVGPFVTGWVDAESVLELLDSVDEREECTAEHVNLLESLIGKLAHRLMQLPGVLGVRVKIAKLEIFEDCEVAIRVETGQW